MSWAVPVGWCLAIQNGLGAGAYLPLLPAGPLRDLIARRVAEGAVFSDADTEPSGASNELRSTTATITADGSAYIIEGEKICIGNGPVADFLVVSATVDDAEGERVECFFLDTTTSRLQRQIGAGVHGPEGRRDRRADVRPGPCTAGAHARAARGRRHRVRGESARAHVHRLRAGARHRQALCALVARVRQPARDRRAPARRVRRDPGIVAATLADAFAIESIVEWCLLAESREDPDDFRLEQSAAKNITSVACWRVVDRTVSLLAAEGLETARSKAAGGRSRCPSSAPCVTRAPCASPEASTSCSTSTSARPSCCPGCASERSGRERRGAEHARRALRPQPRAPALRRCRDLGLPGGLPPRARRGAAARPHPDAHEPDRERAAHDVRNALAGGHARGRGPGPGPGSGRRLLRRSSPPPRAMVAAGRGRRRAGLRQGRRRLAGGRPTGLGAGRRAHRSRPPPT